MAEAHHCPVVLVENVKVTEPLLPVVPVPVAASVPVHVPPEYTDSATLAPLTGLLLDVTLTVKGTL